MGECDYKGRKSQKTLFIIMFLNSFIYILSLPKQKVASLTGQQEAPRMPPGINNDNETNDDNYPSLPIHLSADNYTTLPMNLAHHHGMDFHKLE